MSRFSPGRALRALGRAPAALLHAAKRGPRGIGGALRRGLPRIGAGAKRVRYALGDILFLIGRGVRRAGGVLRRLWFALPLVVRQRLAAALAFAALIAAGWYGVVPNLPCSFPAGDRCPPSDDAEKIAPADSLAFLHVNLDPDTEQYAALARIAGRTPAVTTQVAGLLLPQFIGTAGAPSDFGSQIRPWFGGEAAVAVVPARAGASEQVELLEAADSKGAQAYAKSIAAGTPAKRPYRDVAVSVDQRGLASAVVGGFLVIGRASGVRAIIDVATGAKGATPLSSDEVAETARDRLPDKRVAEAYFSKDGLAQFFADRRDPLAPFEPLVNAGGSRGAAVALVADDQSLELATRSVIDADRAKARPGFFAAFPAFTPGLASRLPGDTLAYLGLGDPRKTFSGLLAQASVQAPALAAGFSGLIKDLRKRGGVDIEKELLPALHGEAALAIIPRSAPKRGAKGAVAGAPETLPAGSASTPFLELIADGVVEKRARDALARLQKPLIDSLNVSVGGPAFQQRRLGGQDAQVLRVSPSAELAYAVFDSMLVAASDPAGVENIAAGGGDHLDGSTLFARATAGLASDPSLVAFLDLSGLLRFGEETGLGVDPAYASFAPDLRKLQGLGLVVSTGKDSLDIDARLLIGTGEAAARPNGTD